MNQNVLLILAVLLALLLGAWLLVPSGRPAPSLLSDASLKRGTKLNENLDPATARSIEIQKGGVTVKLEKVTDKADKGEGYWVAVQAGQDVKAGRKADAERVDQLLRSVRDASVVEPRDAELKWFDLDDEHKLTLKIMGEGGKPLAEWLVGKSPDYDRCFIKHPTGQGSQSVIEADQNIQDKAGIRTVKNERAITEDYWYDLRVTKFNQDDVVEIAIARATEKGEEKVLLKKVAPKPEEKKDEKKEDKKDEPKEGEKKDGEKKDEKKEEPKAVWQIIEPGPQEADQSNANQIASNAAFLFAMGYADNTKPDALGLDKPAGTVTVTLKDGTVYGFVFGKTVDDSVIMQVKGRPEIWRVAKYNFQGLCKELKDLKKPDVATPKSVPRGNAPPLAPVPNADPNALPVAPPPVAPVAPVPPVPNNVPPPGDPHLPPVDPLAPPVPKGPAPLPTPVPDQVPAPK